METKDNLTTLCNKKHIIGFDILRIIFSFIVVLFHLKGTVMSRNIIDSAMFMFFMLSGFSLQYVNLYKDVLIDKETLKKFYIKRIATLFPVYVLVEVFRVVVDESVLKRFILLPLRLLGLQTAFTEMDFFVGVTWFNSCLIISYLIFPFINHIIYMANIKTRRFMFVVLLGIYFYINCLCNVLHVDISFNLYYNVLVRIFEFTLGALLVSVIAETNIKFRFSNCIFSMTAIASFIMLLLDFGALINTFKIFFTILLLICSFYIDIRLVNKNSYIMKIINYFSTLSLEVFMVQDIIKNPACGPIWGLINNPDMVVPVKFVSVYVLAIIIHHLYTVHIKRIILNKFLKK